MQPSLIEVANHMIAEVQRRGQTPITFLMNEATANRIADDLESVVKRRMSTIQLLWHRLTGKGGWTKLTHLHGVPVTEATHIPPGGMFLQVMDSNVIGMHATSPQPQQNAPGIPQEFMRREKTEASQNSDAAPTLSDIASENSDRPSVSSVLIEAMAGADNIDSIVVIRVHKNQDIDLCLNCNGFELRGILSKAHEYLLMRGL